MLRVGLESLGKPGLSVFSNEKSIFRHERLHPYRNPRLWNYNRRCSPSNQQNQGFKLRIYGAADELQAAEQRGHDSAADAEHKGGGEATFEEEV
jgi:hypothetical protein